MNRNWNSQYILLASLLCLQLLLNGRLEPVHQSEWSSEETSVVNQISDQNFKLFYSQYLAKRKKLNLPAIPTLAELKSMPPQQAKAILEKAQSELQLASTKEREIFQAQLNGQMKVYRERSLDPEENLYLFSNLYDPTLESHWKFTQQLQSQVKDMYQMEMELIRHKLMDTNTSNDGHVYLPQALVTFMPHLTPNYNELTQLTFWKDKEYGLAPINMMTTTPLVTSERATAPPALPRANTSSAQ